MLSVLESFPIFNVENFYFSSDSEEFKVLIYMGQIENSEIPETTEITEKAVKQGDYKFCQ